MGARPDGRLAAAVAPTRRGFVDRLRGLLGGGRADAATWEAVEETLIAADVGPLLAGRLVAAARRRGEPPLEAVRAELGSLLVAEPAARRPAFSGPTRPHPVLVVGVNGVGKTTTIAKLAARLRSEHRTVLLAAADTFRAAAIEQLRVWAGRLDLPMVAHAPGADPGAVLFDALDAAAARGLDVVIADTAGRLHTKRDLMDELAKLRRVIERKLPGARPDVLLVVDATTGQNGLPQARVFHEAVGVTGIVVAKLDSTARGGIVFAIEHELGVPVVLVGAGERLADLEPFDPAAFVGALFDDG